MMAGNTTAAIDRHRAPIRPMNGPSIGAATAIETATKENKLDRGTNEEQNWVDQFALTWYYDEEDPE